MMNGSKLDSSTIDSSKLGSWTAFAPVDNYTCKDNTLTITPTASTAGITVNSGAGTLSISAPLVPEVTR